MGYGGTAIDQSGFLSFLLHVLLHPAISVTVKDGRGNRLALGLVG